MIKPQLGILVPIVAAVTIRRALWPAGGYGAEGAAGAATRRRRLGGRDPRADPDPHDRPRGLLHGASSLSIPFGLGLPGGLIEQIFKTAGGYPYLSVNACNPWALVDASTAAASPPTTLWVCDVVEPSGPSRSGRPSAPRRSVDRGDPGRAWSGRSSCSSSSSRSASSSPAGRIAGRCSWASPCSPSSSSSCRPGSTSDTSSRSSPSARSWPRSRCAGRVAYLASSLATLANMYVVLTTLYPNNPGIDDWLGIGPGLGSWTVIAVARDDPDGRARVRDLRAARVGGRASRPRDRGRRAGRRRPFPAAPSDPSRPSRLPAGMESQPRSAVIERRAGTGRRWTRSRTRWHWQRVRGRAWWAPAAHGRRSPPCRPGRAGRRRARWASWAGSGPASSSARSGQTGRRASSGSPAAGSTGWTSG